MDTKPRLVANAIETKAKTIPDAPWLLYAKSSSWEQEGGYKTITWKQCANAINKMAHFLDENIPRQSKGRQTITYQGPNDARYYIMMVAAAKSKRTVSISLAAEAYSSGELAYISNRRFLSPMEESPQMACSRFWMR